MDHLGKKHGLQKQKKKKTSEMEIEDEAVDYEHISKQKDFQTVTFDFLEPDHKYQPSLLMLTQKSFGFVNWDIFPLFEAICEQNEFGIFLGVAPEEADDKKMEDEEKTNSQYKKAEEQEDVYAVLSIVNLKLIQANGFLQKLTGFLLPKIEPSYQTFLHGVLVEKPEKTGLLVNDRVINLPQMIVPSIFEQLLEDKHFIDSEYDFEEQSLYQFNFLIYFIPCYAKEESKKQSEPKGQGLAQKESPGYLYYKQEDQHLHKKALMSLELPHKFSAEFKIVMAVLKYDDFLLMVAGKSIFN